MNNSKVSIITPCYNAEAYIKDSLDSILQQTYKDWELIIIDDASTDNSIRIIEKYMIKDKRIKLFQNQQNSGVSQSRNRALKEANGDYIAFLDSDDLWLPTKLEKQIHLMETENILMSYSSYSTIDEKGNSFGYFHSPKKVTYNDMLKTSTIGTLTTIYNAKILGKFYFKNIGHEDYVMKLQILKQIKYAQGIDEHLAKYRIVKKSLSRNKLSTSKWQWHIYRKIEKLSLLKSIYYFIHYAYHGFFKYR